MCRNQRTYRVVRLLWVLSAVCMFGCGSEKTLFLDAIEKNDYESAQQLLDQAYARNRYLEDKVDELERENKELEREVDKLEDEVDKWKDRYEDAKD